MHDPAHPFGAGARFSRTASAEDQSAVVPQFKPRLASLNAALADYSN
jgi:hypothetical protein